MPEAITGVVVLPAADGIFCTISHYAIMSKKATSNDDDSDPDWIHNPRIDELMERLETPRVTRPAFGVTWQDIEDNLKRSSNTLVTVTPFSTAKKKARSFTRSEDQNMKRMKMVDEAKKAANVQACERTKRERQQVEEYSNRFKLHIDSIKQAYPKFQATLVTQPFLGTFRVDKEAVAPPSDEHLLRRPRPMTSDEELLADSDSEGRGLDVTFSDWIMANESGTSKAKNDHNNNDVPATYKVVDLEQYGLDRCQSCWRRKYKCHDVVYGPFALNKVMSMCTTCPERCTSPLVIKKVFIDSYNRALGFDNFRNNGITIHEVWRYPPLCMQDNSFKCALSWYEYKKSEYWKSIC